MPNKCIYIFYEKSLHVRRQLERIGNVPISRLDTRRVDAERLVRIDGDEESALPHIRVNKVPLEPHAHTHHHQQPCRSRRNSGRSTSGGGGGGGGAASGSYYLSTGSLHRHHHYSGTFFVRYQIVLYYFVHIFF